MVAPGEEVLFAPDDPISVEFRALQSWIVVHQKGNPTKPLPLDDIDYHLGVAAGAEHKDIFIHKTTSRPFAPLT